jgi:hypothetical protein
MPRETADSAVIAAVRYDAASQRRDIGQTTGRVYRYLDVPPEVCAALMTAESKGRYDNDHIRDVYL